MPITQDRLILLPLPPMQTQVKMPLSALPLLEVGLWLKSVDLYPFITMVNLVANEMNRRGVHSVSPLIVLSD